MATIESLPPADAAPKLSRSLRAQIVATLLGGTLLVCAILAGWLWKQPLFAALPAMAAILLLAGPLVASAAGDLLQGKAGMNALVALAVIGAMSTGQYVEAAAVAFFMIVSSLIERRTAAGAEASIESLIRLAPTKASRLVAAAEHVHSCGVRQMRSAATLPRSASQASASASSAGDSCRPRMPQPGLRRGAAKKASGGQNANDSGFSGVSTGIARDLNCCATGGLLAGGGIPRVVYARTLIPSARRSAHGRCPLRVSHAAPPPASCQPRAGTPLRASAPREDTAPQDRVGAS
jgi:hypothetical protein